VRQWRPCAGILRSGQRHRCLSAESAHMEETESSAGDTSARAQPWGCPPGARRHTRTHDQVNAARTSQCARAAHAVGLAPDYPSVRARRLKAGSGQLPGTKIAVTRNIGMTTGKEAQPWTPTPAPGSTKQ
jgi:hypothetical protein